MPDNDEWRRMMGTELIEAARKAGADLEAAYRQPSPAATPERGDDEADDCYFFGC